MQRIKNYGSFLQAFSLKKTIEELGAEVRFVDYKVERPKVVNSVQQEKISTLKRISMIPSKLFSKEYWRLRKLNSENDFDKRYEGFLLELGVDSEYNYNTEDLDMLIVGSDEVFNCLQANPNVGYSRDLFGYSCKSKRLISYAASFGSTTIEKLEQYNCDSEISDMLQKFDDISVRDENSGKIVKKLIDREVNYNVDPVFLYDFSNNINDIEVKLENYIVVYAYGGRITEREQAEIKRFAKKYNKKLVSIGVVQSFCDINIVLSPFELLAYIKNADFVITDTFHGSVFSIKYNKKFVTIIRESNKQKLGDLLRRFGVYDRKIESIDELENIIMKDIDYDIVNKTINEKVKDAKEYLENNIKNISR